MLFEEDPLKALANAKKHGVTFQEAASAFGDAMSFTFPDPDHSLEEERWLMFGMSHLGRVLAIIYTQRGTRYRIISARPVTRRERKIYEEG